jgi:hypothetical protein
MKAVKDLRKKVAARASSKAQIYSTSEARANFAEALETAQLQNTVIGFDRYGRPIAALVSIDAVRMLAGMDSVVEASVRDKIKRMAGLFLHNMPSAEPEPAPRKKMPAPSRGRAVAAKKKKKARGAASKGKR